MLVLSRHRDESVIIGDGLVKVTVVELRGDKVRLGFEAPKEIPIHREEVFLEIRRERAEAAGAAGALELPDAPEGGEA